MPLANNLPGATVQEIHQRPLPDFVRNAIDQDCVRLVGHLESLVMLAERAGRLAATNPGDTIDQDLRQSEIRERIANIVADVQDDRVYLHQLIQPVTHPHLTQH